MTTEDWHRQHTRELAAINNRLTDIQKTLREIKMGQADINADVQVLTTAFNDGLAGVQDLINDAAQLQTDASAIIAALAANQPVDTTALDALTASVEAAGASTAAAQAAVDAGTAAVTAAATPAAPPAT